MQNQRNVIPEASVITDFAITSVNVPDRLDAQEVRARAESEADSPRSRRTSVRSVTRWLLGVVAAVAVGIAGLGAARALLPLLSASSAEGIASRLSQAMGRRVTVADAGVRLAPTPRLVIEGIDVADRFRIDSVSLRFSWGSLAKFVQNAGWDWGEASVGPLELTPDQAFALLQAGPMLSSVVPAAISTIRFESVRFRDAGILPARYEISARRANGEPFREFTLQELESTGRSEIGIRVSDSNTASFRFRAVGWRAPFGPAVEWGEASADGAFAPERLRVDNFSVSGFLGVVTGSLVAVRAGDWTVRGALQASNIDLSAIEREAQKRAKLAPGGASAPALQGVMESSAVLSGRGTTLVEALDRMSATGRAQVRLAALNGINLGASAIRESPGSASGGATRFNDIEATFTVSRGTVRVHDVNASAGALRVRGALGIDPNFNLGGVLRAEVSSPGQRTPSDVRVSGTLFDPVFDN